MKFMILCYILLLISIINIRLHMIRVFEILEIIWILKMVWDFENSLGFRY